MTNNNQIESIEEAIISVLKYYGLFSYPLKSSEIRRFLGIKATQDEVDTALSVMLERKDIFISSHGFYSTERNENWSKNRLQGNERAEDLLNRSHKYIKNIIRFPFVRSVAISGSLSKYYTDEDADIDYFIITAKNRLWIARTLLHFYKKFTFLKRNEHYYCMNYFVDETALEIDQKNIYSAIETVTLIPFYNKEIISELKKLNKSWVDDFLPNENYKEDLRFMVYPKYEWVKRFTERLINILDPECLNRRLMKATDKKWRRKWARKSYPMDRYNEAFYTTINISKNHPANYQSQILQALEHEDNNGLKKEFEECEV